MLVLGQRHASRGPIVNPLPSLPLQPEIPGTPAKARPGPKPKLSAERWFIAALEILAVGGIDAVRVEGIAEALGVTKGMFYVRFESRDAFLEAMMDYWRQRTTTGLVAELGAMDASPQDRLARLFTISQTDRARIGASIELAMRTWALTDDRPARALAEIDRQRLAYFESVVIANGIPAEQAPARAFMIYTYAICDTLLPGNRDAMRDICRSFLSGNTG